MLVFFLHGVATKNADYAKPLQNLLRHEFTHRQQPLPHFYAGFWGNVFKQTGQIWNYIWEDANLAERTARTVGQAHAAMAVGVSDAHCSYWQSCGTARMIASNLMGDTNSIESLKISSDKDPYYKSGCESPESIRKIY